MRTQLLSAACALTKRLSVLLIVLCTAFASAFAQQVTITGTVTDDIDEPLPGVSVVIKGQKQGVMTDIDGHYQIKAQIGDIITFSYIGMKTQEIKVISGITNVDVILSSDSNVLDEVVAVAYGQQKRGTITGAVSTVKGSELLNVPTMSISNIVGSRVAGIASKQTSGEPGADAATLTLRGMSGIIYVIDGVKRTSQDFNQLDPNEIDQVSILKDAASVAIYGLDANGVIIVTTKRGKNEKTKISYSGSVGFSQNAENQEWLDGPGYAYWYNKGLEMDGLQPIFTEEHVRKMIQGVDGWGNTNWYKEVFGTGFRTAHNISATGGNERIKFFAAISYLKEDGNVDKFGFDRWNLRSNIDADITSGLKFTMNISARLQDQDNPYWSANPDAYGNIGSQMVRMLPYLPKTMTYEGNEYYVGNKSNPSSWSVLNAIYNSGYNKVNHNNFNTNMALQWDTPFLPGLSLKFNLNYDANFQFTKLLNNQSKCMVYTNGANQNLAPDVLLYNLAYVSDTSAISLTENASRNSTMTTLTTVSYNNSFGNHNISALLLAETRDYKTNNIGGTAIGLTFPSLDVLDKTTGLTFAGEKIDPTLGGTRSMARNAGFAARINYNYDEKYFVEASVRRDGSYLFGGMNKRWITLPGVSVGWRIDREDFFTADWVNNLKIRGGFGQTATSGISPFMWRNTMAIGKNGVVIGSGTGPYIYADILGNPTLTWSQCDNYNIGFDGTLWNGLLSAEFDVFYKYEHDILTNSTGAYPPSMGGYYYGAANLNKNDYKGFDLTLTHNNRVGNVSYGAKLIWSYAYGRYLYVASDSPNKPDYQRLTGKQIGTKLGFIANGLYQSQDEIDNAPYPDNVTNKTLYLGDIKYVDRDGDGKITYNGDMGYVGKSNMPTHTGSLDLFANWKGFDIDVLFAWGLGHEVALTGVYTASTSSGIMDHTSYTLPFKWYGNSPVYLVENSWTPEHTDADFPRLCASPLSNNNAYASTFWYKNGNYLRMKSFAVGYTIPQHLIQKAHISKLRVYVEGYNLFTFSGLSKFNIDPEAPAVNNGYYPQQRKMSVGINLTF